MKIKVVHETAGEYSESLLKRCISETAKSEGGGKDFSCTLVLVEPEKIAKLNEEHYGKKGPTDVLSFSSDEEGYSGEIIICPSYIKEHTTEESFKWELCHAAVHGTMHLLGIHHEHSAEAHAGIHKKEEEIINNILNG